MTMTADQLRAIDMLEPEEVEALRYKQHPLVELLTTATPHALVKRAAIVRANSNRYHDAESLAAHLELAAETISELCRYLPR